MSKQSTSIFSILFQNKKFNIVWIVLVSIIFQFNSNNLFAQPKPGSSLVNSNKQFPPVLRTLKKSHRSIFERLKEFREKSLCKSRKQNFSNEEEEGELRFDRPDLALEQENRLTRDPALGYVPRERLNLVIEEVQQQRSQRSSGSQPTDVMSTATWVERGPVNVGGRTRALMFDPNDITNKKVWAGGVGGGLWYTNDITVASPIWNNVNSFWANIAISSIAYNPSNTLEFYVGTGEGFGNLDAIRGSGIWKTTDGGITWSQLSGLSTDVNFDYINKLAVTSTGVVFAATSSRYCNRGGIYKSINGGTSWSLVLGTHAATCGASNSNSGDIEIGTDGTIYAAIGLWSTGALYKSIDVGVNWTQINTGANGFPNSGLSRIEVCVAPSDANRLYAMAQNSSDNKLLNIYTSIDKGTNWTTCTLPTWYDSNCSTPTSDMTRTQSWYDMIIAVDPLNPATLLVGGVDVMKSTNSGTSWTQISSWCTCCSRQFMHADQHAILYQPGSSSISLFGNDGGVFYSTNVNLTTPTFSGKNSGYNVTQFYSCAIHPGNGQNYFLAGAQDNGTQKFSNSGLNSTVAATGGDGGFTFIDQTNPTYQISSYTHNSYNRSSNNWASSSSISSSSTTGDFINPADYDDANHILYSAYSATQIQRVSGVTDVTPASPVQFTVTNMAAMASHLRVSPYAPANTTTLYVGTQDSKLFKVTNAENSPSTNDISSASFPSGASISCVEIGATENDLLVTFSNYGVTSIWRSTNGGSSWSNKEGNLPDMPVRWAMYNPLNRNEVFLATELGVWSTADITVASPVWVANNNNLANVRVDMFQIRNADNEVIAATHGRGLFSTSVFGAPPVSNFTANNLTACPNTDIVFTSTSTGSISSYLWNFGSGATPATSTAAGPVTVQYSSSGTKTISLTVTGVNGTNTKTSTNYITISAGTGVIGAINSASIICYGETNSPFSVSPVSGATSYVWTVPSGATITSGQGTNAITANFGLNSGNVSVYALNGVCFSPTFVKAIVVNSPVSIPVITASGPAVYCNGDFLQLTASQPAITCGTATSVKCAGVSVSAIVGNGILASTTSTYPTPYGNFYESTRQQYLFTKDELFAQGLRAGTITSLSFDVANINTSGIHNNYTIKLLCTNATSITTFQSGAQIVFGPVSYTPINGINTHLLTSIFDWDGNSNLIVEICHNNDTGTGNQWTVNASVKYTGTTFTSCVLRRGDQLGSLCGSNTVTATSANRPNIIFNGCGVGNVSYTWSNNSTSNPLPITAVGNYSVTVMNAGGCTKSASINILSKPPLSATIHLLIQGFYISANNMTPALYNSGLSTDITDCDSVVVELHDEIAPFGVHQTMQALLKTNGTIECSPLCDALNHSYYIVIKTRNSIETWSKNPVLFTSTTNFRFDQ